MVVPLVSFYKYLVIGLAVLAKEKIVMVGQKTPNNLIFVFSSNGKRFKTIELETLIEGITT